MLGGCNAVYGLVEPNPRDAGIYDGLPDAPFTCPVNAVPEFVHANLVQMIAQNCTNYTRNDTIALAQCPYDVDQGVPDQMMSPATLPPITAAQHYLMPRLAPDAPIASIVVSTEIGPSVSFTQNFYRYDATTRAWTQSDKLMAGSGVRQTSEPSREPGAHILALENDGVHEFVHMGGWVDKVLRPELGLLIYEHLHLSADGLMAYWDDANGVEVAVRSSIDASFTKLGSIANTLGFQYPFITADCGRLYFYTLDSVWLAGRAP